MNQLIYDTLKMLFQNTLVADVYKFIKTVMDGLTSLFTNADVNQYFTIFTAVAASLLIVFFFIDMASNASKDMITLERLILSFIKLMLGVTIMMYLPEIINGLFGLIHGLYGEAAKLNLKDVTYDGITFFGEETFPEKFDEDTMKFVKGNVFKAIGNNLACLFICGVGSLFGLLAQIAAYLFTITNAITLITRAIFCPLAVAQCFEDGQRSVGVQFLKKFMADGLSLAVMLGLLYAASLLQANITGALLQDITFEGKPITNIDKTNAVEIITTGKLIVTTLAINLSCVGAIMKANQLAHDIVGAH